MPRLPRQKPFAYTKPTIIAEIGAVHIGNMDRAKALIKMAHIAGADVAKFQKRNPLESVSPDLRNLPHPNQRFAYGKTYLEHRMNLEFSIEQHAELKQYCESVGIEYSTSVWDMTSAKEVVDIEPKFIKVPSACNMHLGMLEYLFSNYDGDVHISLGMISADEKDKLRAFLAPFLDRLVVYHCTSSYPCPFENLYVREIEKLRQNFPRVGFSNHGYGIATDVAAYTLGATYIERHFVDDRCFPHTDASASLEPGGLDKLCRDLKAIHKAMAYKPDELIEEEKVQRNKLRWVESKEPRP